MNLRILDGNLLIRDGVLAADEDCCCTPPCLPCTSKVFQCYPDPCGGCLSINSITVSISDSDDPTSYSGCVICNLMNGSYVAPLPSSSGGFTTQFTAFNQNCTSGIRRSQVTVSWLWSDTDITLTAGAGSYFDIEAVNCTDFTIYKGHWVFVAISDYFDFGFIRLPSGALQYFAGLRVLYYAKSFNNADQIANCPEDQLYGLCSGLSLGELTLVSAKAQRYLRPIGAVILNGCNELPDYPFCTIPNVDLTAIEIEVSAC